MYNDNNQIDLKAKCLKLIFTFVVLLHWFELYLIKVVDMNEYFNANLYFFVYLFLLSGIVYGCFKMSNGTKHFLMYSALLSLGCYVNLLVNIEGLSNWIIIVASLLIKIIPIIRVYYMTHAFAQLLEDNDSHLKQKWLDLWKCYKYTFLALLSSLVLMFVLPNLSQLILRVIRYVSIYLIFLEVWYFFTTVLYFDALSRGKVEIEARKLTEKWYVKTLFVVACFVSSFMILFNFQTITINNGKEVLIYNSPFNHKPGGAVRNALGKELDSLYGECWNMKQPIDMWNGNDASVYDTTIYEYKYLGQDIYGGDYILCTVYTSRNVQFKEYPEYFTHVSRSLSYIGYDDDNIQSSRGAELYWDTLEEKYSYEGKDYFDGLVLNQSSEVVYGVVSDEDEVFDIAVYYDVIDSDGELKIKVRDLDIIPKSDNVSTYNIAYYPYPEPYYYEGVQTFSVNGDFEYKVNNLTKVGEFSIDVYSRKWEEV